ncbi:MAG: hypothetical protein M1837_004028 [Sclerophora amabilis]|nr:MAG: hypothetical protein M1837_004028 [Sclerophora amabilis]
MGGEYASPVCYMQGMVAFGESDDDEASPTRSASTSLPSPSPSRLPRRTESNPRSHPRALPTPNESSGSPIHANVIPSSPASPPTPAPSPTPQERIPRWDDAGEDEDSFLRDARSHFSRLDGSERQRYLAEILNLCDSHQLSFVHSFVSPRLKKDPFHSLPNELCLRILSFVDDPVTLARASQVSKRWHELLSDDMTWKILCEKHAYRRLSDNPSDVSIPLLPELASGADARLSVYSQLSRSNTSSRVFDSLYPKPSSSAPNLTTRSLESSTSNRFRPKAVSYKSHFKQRYMVETAWRSGGRAICRHITPDQGVVTSLHLTPKYIVVALDNAKIHVFNTDGDHQKTLSGHVMGVWAMVPWGDTLVSGGCDRDVRVWNMMTGENVHTLRGHTSTVRCLKMSEDGLAISGSRDTTLRIWDITTGVCRNVLVGHSASVRCLEIKGDIVVSGSYDTMARVWSISEGRCLRILNGHFSQIYAIAFDGTRIATGSLDTSVRIWDPHTGHCHGILQGHTSLVGQLQMRGETLVTGGSDGSVRVWSLRKMAPIHRLAAHDNSVTSLQFDETRVVSGGSDGRVKVWDLKTGQLVRELSSPAEAVWRVAFEEEKAVIMASRASKTIMEVRVLQLLPEVETYLTLAQVWSFSPPEEGLSDISRSSSPMSLPDSVSTGDQDGDTKMLDASFPRLSTSRRDGELFSRQ